ncbi:hypothetical protein [Luteibacter yeojuensis]|uniref:hypothetical protein n=1 Tax=Luteibacter yeojuensis TaxID=345309 RepID=UPI0012ED1DA2|nr:hypothetical protein [Luteibacter yeojuensis]
MIITDGALLSDLDNLSGITGRDPEDLVVEILRSFFRPAHTHQLVNEFRWRIEVLGGIDIDSESAILERRDLSTYQYRTN